MFGFKEITAPIAIAADCKVAVVGSPHNSCWDIANAAGISVSKLQSFNGKVDCQRLCVSAGTLPDISPKPKPDGSCAIHKVGEGAQCDKIAEQYHITAKDIEKYNEDTYKWKGCNKLQIGALICVSPGKPPPIPVNPDLQCGPESPGNKTCPLNVCCSAYGFCGQTEEFCEDAPNGDPCLSNCGYPKLKTCGGGQLKRKIGYYAGWAARRKCQDFSPENLDLKDYTGVIFSFATISQSNKIELDSKDKSLLRDLVGLKSRWPSLEVTIAVGGWAFSNDDPTQHLFTRMISTKANRGTFIDSVKKFLDEYKLDGIDIDMEYPAAMEREAPVSDTPNLTAFFKEARAALGKKVISVATPAGYWFLRGFAIDKIAKDVTYINMMSYDYHGPWDLKVQGEDGIAKPHTSSKDIMDSIRLYTRAGVDFDKINLGLAWYGRTYAVGGCKGTKCKMSGGGKPGPCTGESSIKSQTEIWNELKKANTKPNYESSTHTYWYNKDNDFITFDDERSWDPVPPDPPVRIGCVHKMPDEKTLNDCVKMVNDIFDTYENQYVFKVARIFCLGLTEPQGTTSMELISVWPPQWHFDLSLATMTVAYTLGTPIIPQVAGMSPSYVYRVREFKDMQIRAKEVKAAALSILETCHGVGRSQRAGATMQMMASPALPLVELVPRIIATWTSIAWLGIASVIIGGLALALSTIFKNWDDDAERGEFVLKTVAQTREDYPEFNVIIAHSDHTPSFEEPCYHRHVEFDRPFPHGTYGYEIYLARRGDFLLEGDGGYINWAWSGVITADPDNEKDLTVNPPGGAYGQAAPVQGKYVEDGELKNVELVVTLGDRAGCASSFGVNLGDPKPHVRCTDILDEEERRAAQVDDDALGDASQKPFKDEL
ncbi:hypothetical protein EST38_g2319 [Candolleomyces aberdarensis]|uniref:Uncharacterized protein n=1 Tax=Candolleomyces aberdarensis TaxID=2316362 RepID=A0A4Q2DX51_9AGAR|nr:hypothetical protein EST38_g2319 [Candolleomyces aberdarensis]